LLHGLRLAISLGIKQLLVYGDSLLVVQQVNNAYVQEVRKLENIFFGLEVHHVLREHNIGADILSKLGSTRAQVPVEVFIQELKQPSIKSSPQITTDTDPQKLLSPYSDRARSGPWSKMGLEDNHDKLANRTLCR
jgi:hypothetical protein